MFGKPAGNVKLGRKFTDDERNDPFFLIFVARMKVCTEDHWLLARFGGTCEVCGKVWDLYR
jgi:hypothetical protein